MDGVIFEPAVHVPHANLRHVGTGHGSYEIAQDFHYVGEGGGDFEREEITVPYGWRLRRCCAGLMCILASLAPFPSCCLPGCGQHPRHPTS